MPKYKIGCSGFLYDSWEGPFYPEGLPHKAWLTYYEQKFDTVELNVTFYRLLKKEAFELWYRETQSDFTFCLKGSRFISHVKKLKDVEMPLSTFFNATAPLLEKLDVVLWQLPPNLKLNLKNLEDFVENLKKYPVRHVFEFRNKTWLTKKVFKLLSAANIAICMADWPEFIDDLQMTADFVYIRRHGEMGSHASNYTSGQLKNDAKRIKEYMKLGKDVYFYFNNDAFAYAPSNAIELKTLVNSILPKSLKMSAAKLAAEKKKTAEKKAAAKKPAKKSTVEAPKKTVKKVTAKKSAIVKKAAKKVTPKKASKKAVKKVTVKKAAKKVVKKTAVKKVTKKVVKKVSAKKVAKKAVKKSASKKTSRKK